MREPSVDIWFVASLVLMDASVWITDGSLLSMTYPVISIKYQSWDTSL